MVVHLKQTIQSNNIYYKYSESRQIMNMKGMKFIPVWDSNERPMSMEVMGRMVGRIFAVIFTMSASRNRAIIKRGRLCRAHAGVQLVKLAVVL